MNTAAGQPTANLKRLSYIRIGYSIDPQTGVVYSVGNRPVGYVTTRWMRNHGVIA
jgi:hypothetical protein